MKLCYIWVERFRNLENFGLNLSSDFTYLYNHEHHHLEQNKKEPLPNDFFDNSISDVMGLIGCNGSGKTNCLELICMALRGGKSRINSDFILLTENNGAFTCFTYNKDKTKFGGPTSNFPLYQEKYDKQINGLNVIYFSNVFDNRVHNFDKAISDLSVNRLWKKSNSVKHHIKFINSNKFDVLRIPRPKFLGINISIYDGRYTDIVNENTNLKISEFRKKIRNATRKQNGVRYFINSVRAAFIFHHLTTLKSISYDSKPFISQEFDRCLSENHEDVDELLIDALNSLKKCFMEVFSKNSNMQYKINVDLDNFTSLFDKVIHIEDHIKNSAIYPIKTGAYRKESFEIEYNGKSDEIINILLDCLPDDSILECTWLGISSGHHAYLNLFSSIYNEVYRSRNDTIICIDEGDLYLHPKWQVEFFDKLNSVLPNISSGDIQLVLSSHSPFLLSDLPTQCITILEPEHSIHETFTFGANLYELYSKAFFLGKERTGIFAFNKIKNVLDLSEKENLTASEKEIISQYKNIIGDKIIKYNLEVSLRND